MNAASHIVMVMVKRVNINYLDDYLFVAATRRQCNLQVNKFIEVCETICFPVAKEKTEWATEILVFLGLLIDCVNRRISIPKEKITRTLEFIEQLLSSKKHKATILQIQRLAGYLNFLCKAIVPGRTYTRRLYSLVSKNLMPHHHVKVPSDILLDLEMWKQFLTKPEAYCRPFQDFENLDAHDIFMFSDALKAVDLDFGALCQNDWMMAMWSDSSISGQENFIQQFDPSIAFLELFALTAGVIQWIYRFANKRVTLFCDNESVVQMINMGVSRCEKCMILLRLVTLESMTHNVRIFAKYIKSEDNFLADALSRGQMLWLWRHALETMNKVQTPIPQVLWPVQKLFSN